MNKRVKKTAARKMRNKILVGMMMTLIVALGCGAYFGGGQVTASKQHDTYKYYTEVKVDLHETLWDIAQEYMTEEYSSEEEYIKEVQEINSIYGDTIYYGQCLTVPYYSAEFK